MGQEGPSSGASAGFTRALAGPSSQRRRTGHEGDGDLPPEGTTDCARSAPSSRPACSEPPERVRRPPASKSLACRVSGAPGAPAAERAPLEGGAGCGLEAVGRAPGRRQAGAEPASASRPPALPLPRAHALPPARARKRWPRRPRAAARCRPAPQCPGRSSSVRVARALQLCVCGRLLPWAASSVEIAVCAPFTFFLRETEREGRERAGERGRETEKRLLSRLPAQRRARCRAQPPAPGITTRTGIRSRARHPLATQVPSRPTHPVSTAGG